MSKGGDFFDKSLKDTLADMVGLFEVYDESGETMFFTNNYWDAYGACWTARCLNGNNFRKVKSKQAEVLFGTT